MNAASDTSPAQDRKRKQAFLWNILTLIVLLTTVCLVVYFVTIFLNPGSVFNPFPPELTPTTAPTLTPTITLLQLPPTWTSTLSPQPISTRTHAPTWTALPGAASRTPTPTETLLPSLSSTPMPASAEIIYLPATEIDPARTCEWLGVGGSVLGTDGAPLQLQTVQLGGVLGEVVVSQLKLSGSAPAYGNSGFEFVLGDRPVASTQTLWIQLFDNTGSALTEKIYFDTFDDCSRNLVKIIFTRIR